MTNSIVNAAAGMILLVTGFLSSVVIARVLGPEANGTIAFALWLVATGSLIAELGTGVSLLRILPQLKVRGYDSRQRRGFASSLMRPVIVATLVVLLLYAMFFWVEKNGYFSATTTAFAAATGLLFLLQSIGSYSKNYLIGEQRLGAFSRLTAVSATLQLTGVTVGAVLAGPLGAVMGYVAGQVAPFVAALRIGVTPRDRCGIDRRQLVLSSLVLIFEFIVSAVFLTRPELFFLQHFETVAAVGLYAVALSLSNLALQLPIQLTGSLLPFYAERREQAAGRFPQPVFESVVRSLSYITLPMCFGLAAISGPLVVALYGEAFRDSGPIVAALSIGAPVYVFLQICTQYLLSMDRARTRLAIAIVGSVVMVAGSIAVIPLMGAVGAAIVRNSVFTVMAICMIRTLRFERSLFPLYGVIARVALSSALCGGAAWLVCQAVVGVPGLMLAVMSGAIVYIGGIRLFRVVPTEDALALQHVSGLLPSRARKMTEALFRLIVVHPPRHQPGE